MRDNTRRGPVPMAWFLLSVIFLAGVPRGAFCQEPGDFREIISHAKSEVFPALIFIKPIAQLRLFGRVIVLGTGR